MVTKKKYRFQILFPSDSYIVTWIFKKSALLYIMTLYIQTENPCAQTHGLPFEK